ncbi:MAG: hypothetical protein J0M12_11320 [Deltaproteobacteria bacterium]|nr:hypothetical protein [Deltaproteobacteria bacterium]
MRGKSKFPMWVVLSVLFVVLQIVDLVLTSVGVSRHELDLEANPLAAWAFSKWGVWQAAIAIKAFSFVVFFSLLWYCVKVRWTVMDVLGLLWNRPPKRDEAYAMRCFYLVAGVTTLVSLYAGCGWIYLLVQLGRVE